MNPDPSKLHLHSQQASELDAIAHIATKQSIREFSSVEEMIRADRNSVHVPEAVLHRLNESVGHEPKPRQSWWRRFFIRGRGQ